MLPEKAVQLGHGLRWRANGMTFAGNYLEMNRHAGALQSGV
jgi:hypothetical protein